MQHHWNSAIKCLPPGQLIAREPHLERPPNVAELREAVGDWASEAQLCERLAELQQQLDIEHVLLTRGEDGRGESLEDAVRAAGLVVGKFGTAAVTPEELELV